MSTGEGGERRQMNRAERRKIKKKCFATGAKHVWGEKDGYGIVCNACGVVKETI